MTQYGSIPGVRITTESGTVSGVTIGREQYHVLVGVGEDAYSKSEQVAVNDPVILESTDDVEAKFGADSDVANAYDRTTNNGANPDFVAGIRAEANETTETFDPSSTGLAETPALVNKDRISAVDADDDSDLDVTLSYKDTLDSAGTDEVIINPYTGDVEANLSGSDVEVTYDYADWSSAFDEIGPFMLPGDFAVVTPLTGADSVATTLDGTLTGIRDDYKMAVGVMGVEYNADKDYGPHLDTGSYSSQIASDNMWRCGPLALKDGDPWDRHVGALSAVAGVFAGNPTTEPIYDDVVTIGDLKQRLTSADVRDLSDQYVVPIRDTGITRIERNHSTYDQGADGGWERDYFTKRIVDLTTVTMYQLARRQIGGVLTGDLVADVRDAISNELGELEADQLLEPGKSTVKVEREDRNTVSAKLDIHPFGVTKAAKVTISVNA